jgi:putative phosphoribosyl transferase
MKRFPNRRDAGRELAQELLKYKSRSDVIVLALPRGGVPVAYEVALALKVPLDIWIVRKLGLPGQEELAIGAIASGGVRILNHDIIQAVGLRKSMIDKVTEQELEELKRREQQYRGNRSPIDVQDRTIILIDDGLATGASMLAAVRGLRTQNPARIIVAVPAAAPQALEILRAEVDEAVFVIAPYDFKGVGNWYEDFSQTTDEEVQWLLAEAERQLPQHDETDDDV